MAQNLAKFLKQSTRLRPDGQREWGRRYDTVRTSVEMLALLGDCRAGDLLVSLGVPRAPGFTDAGVASGVHTAYFVLAQTNARRAARGLPPLVPMPRPGAETAMTAVLERQPLRQWRGWR